MVDLIKFLNVLKSKNIKFDLSQDRPESIMVTFTLVGCRVEVDFFEDHIEFSYFTGDESVHDDWKIMQSLLDKHWSDD
ncbi:MAG: hypothetical protein IOC64_00850 [Methylobacterium sp.]|nr:hypothetical protein [Methylobacterium sp.]MCA3599744.1 hypothetical protein [Methylobacterium sp.]MCA3606115.1 hypothetical protein [Methylobacterium sp.]MCA3609646.1 hypothetical protein [Methylobacterium sp.]MCA3616220.1 hypothetical protein [Methylobacterium sp.]